MLGQRLYKIEKLRSEIAIGQLFDRSNPAAHSVMAYPLRAVWTINPSRLAALTQTASSQTSPVESSDTPHRKPAPCPQFLIAVPKKKIRHAVDRVQMRRRIREAYRLNRHLIPMDLPIDIAFIYVAGEVLPYAEVLKAVTRILTRITRTLTTPATTISPNS
ncbi:ribonuclease P protein component [uncultured Duncaniella sp.]|uniref:ribonuclease P protein component n=2 Tax=uncultured Duncaniella sp. TaxID=2768039 RepID=UPI0025E3B0DA|nr:ribonuclease P protein component [uncultured Duncaniella sp.]